MNFYALIFISLYFRVQRYTNFGKLQNICYFISVFYRINHIF